MRLILMRWSILTGAFAFCLFANDALACHGYKSLVDGKVGCSAYKRDRSNPVSAESGSTSTSSNTSSSDTSSSDTSSSNTSSSDTSNSNTSKAISDLCPGAKLLIASEVMSWDKKADTSKGSSARASIQSNGKIRYLQIDVKKGVEQKTFERIFRPFQKNPLSCAVYQFDVYLSPNYDGAATAPNIGGRKGPASLIGGFGYNSPAKIGNANPADVRAPELNKGFSAINNWRSEKPDAYFYAYSANRYALGAKYNKSAGKLYGKIFVANQSPRKSVQPGKWSRVSFAVKVNDDRQSNGRGQIWIDGIKTIDLNKFMWAYEPSKSGGITGYRVRHMYGGTSSKLIPTQNQYERYRNLEIWGVQQ